MNLRATLSILAICASLVSFPVLAQLPSTLWTRSFGGDGHDYLNCLQLTSDGGFIGTGYTHTFGAGAADFWLLKFDEQGHQIWMQTYGGPDHDYAYCVRQTSDDCFIIAGRTKSFGTPAVFDGWLVKADAEGNELWSHTYGSGLNQEIRCVIQTADNGFLLAGSESVPSPANEDIMLIKTDYEGNVVWTHFIEGDLVDNLIYDVQQCSDGNYIMTGYSAPNICLIKADTLGNVLWWQNFDDVQGHGKSVRETADGGFILTGDAFSLSGDVGAAFLFKTDPDGDIEWHRFFGGEDEETGECVQLTQDGGYILTGQTRSLGNQYDIFVIKTDADGDPQWSQTYFDYGSSDQASWVLQTPDDGYILAGTSNLLEANIHKQGWLIRLDREDPRLNFSLNPLSPIEMKWEIVDALFKAEINNSTAAPVTFDVWTEAEYPNGDIVGPILLRQGLSLMPGDQIEVRLAQNVPNNLPVGTYLYRGYAGTYPSDILTTSEFTVCILESPTAQTKGEWAVSGNWPYREVGRDPAIPGELSITSVYPNPFNPAALISVNLIHASELSVLVYNVTGQQVAELAQGLYNAGDHQFLFDGRGFSSGIYLVRAATTEGIEVTKKIVLVK